MKFEPLLRASVLIEALDRCTSIKAINFFTHSNNYFYPKLRNGNFLTSDTYQQSRSLVT